MEGTGCESHTMASAVCISNPSNGIHKPSSLPSWMEDLLGSTPTGSALLYACADPVKTPLRVTPGRRKFLEFPQENGHINNTCHVDRY